MVLLNIENLSHSFSDNIILKDVNLSLKSGEVMCLLGPSGCGKTTLLRLISGLEETSKGRISLGGVQVSVDDRMIVAPEYRNIGLVFQDYALFPHMTVYENVAFGLRDLSEMERSTQIMDSLSHVSMLDYIDRYPNELSGGQQQRVSLARAIAPKPTLILMDEPFSGLDARLRDAVREETLSVIRETGASTIVVTHDPQEAMYMADEICLLNKGKLEQIGTPDELYNRPQTPFVCEFMGEINTLLGVVRNGVVDTAVGTFKTPSYIKDGQNCEILFRPENTQFKCGGVGGNIISVHSLGSSSLVVIGMQSGERIRIRIPGNINCTVGEQCSVNIENGVTPYIFSV